MSKAAVYAGLGQGLMSLGQGIGKAIEVTAIEKLREENMRKNWARQDAMKAEDREFQMTLEEKRIARENANKQDNREYQEGLIEKQHARQDTIRQEDNAAAEARFNKEYNLKVDRLNSAEAKQEKAIEEMEVKNQNRTFRSITAQDTKRIDRLQTEMAKIEAEMRKAQADGGFIEPLVKQYEATKAAYDKANEAYEDKVLAAFDGDEGLSPKSQPYEVLRRIKFDRTKREEVTETPKPGNPGPSVDDVLNNGKTVKSENATTPQAGKKYGRTLGDATGVNQLGGAIGGLMNDIGGTISDNNLVAKYAKEGPINMSQNELSRAYQRAKDMGRNDIAQKIMSELQQSIS